MKKLFAAIPVLVLAVAALTGCTSSSPSNVEITGDFGGVVTLEPGFQVNAPGSGKVEVIEQGDAPTKDADTLVARRTLFNGENGEKLYSGAFVMPTDNLAEQPEWLRKIVTTTGVDQRSVIVVRIADVYGEGVGEQLEMSDTTPLVIVDDVLVTAPKTANGIAQDLPTDFPIVKLAKDGQPTVTIPSGDAPAELMIADSKVGDGATVVEGDEVVLQYQGVNWSTGEVFDQSWGKTGPTVLNTNGVIPGFKKALLGQKVGSQVVVIIPPAEGYGSEGNSNAGIEGTDTLVFVIDILATVPALPAAE